jgi:gamma-glutamyl phosphate reductase
MRSIFVGIIVLSASTAAAHAAQAEKHSYVQALTGQQQTIQASPNKQISAAQVHPNEDALTKRIERDNEQLDRMIQGICTGC